MLKKIFVLLMVSLLIVVIAGCSKHEEAQDNILVIFHAGSLSVPLQQMKDEFLKTHPGVEIFTEASGSRMCARKIADLHKECDVMMSADYSVIDNILIPKYASWCIKFATNQMAIVYTSKSKYANEINSKNWYKILSRPDVVCGHSNPNDDPCGYRALITMKLASIYYKDKDLFAKIENKKNGMISRASETDFISLLEAGQLDYVFLYKSVAVQHHLKYVELPPQINLSSMKYAKFYKEASVELSGPKVGTKIIHYGEPILYGLTIPKDSLNPKLAMEFVEFVLSKNGGEKIMEANGQNSVVPAVTSTYDQLPDSLKKYALKAK